MKRIDKRIRYQAHAERRLAERGISRDQIARALRHPDVERKAKRFAAKRFEKSISKRRRLVVIVEEEASEFWVISAWWN